ncbi:MAG: hypothetical protein ABF893_09565 [Gluconacetobacter liquefaciens]|uniref:Uncharacterized protein n=1 Tax=Gluconacetobacter liquefaciens TaxID=89584 RepID=A0A370G5B7_GLULI|nr:hypothetical protein [Gluconacetobacter liquefaciens]MBB2186800.1 hypothetical protein [Gluconacetobacter liquefaciens]RDI37784.1 hypothetical protein C7453_105193 [Gluconacetobacter liquefaciens]
MTVYPCCTTQAVAPSADAAAIRPSRMKAGRIMTGVIRYGVAFVFSAFPWIFIVFYMVISISASISFMYLTHSQK